MADKKVKLNYRDSECKCCLFCDFHMEDSWRSYYYCNADHDFPGDWLKADKSTWSAEHLVGEYGVCDNFKEE